MSDVVLEFQPLVSKMAWCCYARLPECLRVVYAVEDLIQEGLVVVLTAVKKFDCKRRGWKGKRASFQTFLYSCLRNFYANLLDRLMKGFTISGGSSKASVEFLEEVIPDTIDLIRELELKEVMMQVSRGLSCRSRQVFKCLTNPPPELVFQCILNSNGVEAIVRKKDIADFLEVSPAVISYCMSEIKGKLKEALA